MKFLPLLLANLMRKKVRTILTIGSFAVAMFLFGLLVAVRAGFRQGIDVAGARPPWPTPRRPSRSSAPSMRSSPTPHPRRAPRPSSKFAASYMKQMGNIEFLIVAIGTVVFFTLLLVTGNTMAIAVRERTNEMAVLKAIGFSDLFALSLVLAESLIIASLGGALGLGLASVVAVALATGAMAEEAPQIARDASGPLLSPEVVVIAAVPMRDSPDGEANGRSVASAPERWRCATRSGSSRADPSRPAWPR